MIDLEGRLNDRFNRVRLRIELKRSRGPLAVLGVGLAVGAVCWLLLVANTGKDLYSSTYEVRFGVPDATSIVAGRHDVRIKGIEVGKITKSELVDGRPVLTASILSRWGRIHRDARARVRPKTALEDMYLDIVDRGTPKAGTATSRDVIPASQVSGSVQIEEVLQAFEPDVRGRLRSLLANLGTGLEDRGAELRTAFQRLTPMLQATGAVAKGLAVRERRTRRVVRDFGTLSAELRRRDQGLRTLIDEGGATLGTIAGHRTGLDATVRELPSTLEELERTFTAVDGIVPEVDRALVALRPAVRELDSGLRGVRMLSSGAQPALSSLERPIRALQPLVRELRPASAALEGAARAILPQVGALDHVTRKVADCTIAVYGFFQWTASVTKFWDSRGTFPRGDATVSVNAPGGATRDPNHFPAAGCMGGFPKRDTP